MRHPGHGEVQHREGYRSIYQERGIPMIVSFSVPMTMRFSRIAVRQEVQSDLALHRRPELRQLRHARDEALHLFLSRTSGDLAVQIRLMGKYNVSVCISRARIPVDDRRVFLSSLFFVVDVNDIVNTTIVDI